MVLYLEEEYRSEELKWENLETRRVPRAGGMEKDHGG